MKPDDIDTMRSATYRPTILSRIRGNLFKKFHTCFGKRLNYKTDSRTELMFPTIFYTNAVVAILSDIVIEKGISFYSVCEHHLLPFFGTVSIGYVPDGKVVGLSKLARTVEIFARRAQIQEQMTTQIAEALQDELKPKGVIVVANAEHLCMSMRGVKKPGTQTMTYKTPGCFTEDEELRKLFFSMIRS